MLQQLQESGALLGKGGAVERAAGICSRTQQHESLDVTWLLMRYNCTTMVLGEWRNGTWHAPQCQQLCTG